MGPKYTPMSETFSKVEEITGVARRRSFTTGQKVVRRPPTLYVDQLCCPSPWALPEPSRQMETSEEGREADNGVVPASEARRLEERVRELGRLLGRKTMEVEILKEALDLHG